MPVHSSEHASFRVVNSSGGKHMPDAYKLQDLTFYTSSFSGGGDCVEVAHLAGGGVIVRDSKNRSRAPLTFTISEWAAFLSGVCNGEFDNPQVT